ncbi:MAG: hypothetical protein HQL97_02870 [Magnetococcales bacterium]|nr:hypothetical protein [Magnetococcales bacterium]MBF0260771.1 hypothetical protein [Magnetococcales bacterium]
MRELYFQVADSHHKPFEVVIRKNGDNLTALCSCPEGENGICVHRLNILRGSVEGIVNGRDDEVRQVVSWVEGTDVGRALRAVLLASNQLQNARDDFVTAKERLVRAMLD